MSPLLVKGLKSEAKFHFPQKVKWCPHRFEWRGTGASLVTIMWTCEGYGNARKINVICSCSRDKKKKKKHRGLRH